MTNKVRCSDWRCGQCFHWEKKQEGYGKCCWSGPVPFWIWSGKTHRYTQSDDGKECTAFLPSDYGDVNPGSGGEK